jgi:hypothetical protein
MSEPIPPRGRYEDLRDALVNRQGLPLPRAEDLAAKILTADDTIVNAALLWARTGEMSEDPRIEGYDAKQLGLRMPPSAAFTALMSLRSDPARALSVLRHHGHQHGARRKPAAAPETN